MQIRRKLQIASILPLAAFLALAALAIPLNRALLRNQEAADRASALNHDVIALISLTYECRGGNERPASQWEDRYAVLLNGLEQGKGLFVDRETGRLLAELEKRVHLIRGHFTAFRRFGKEGRQDAMVERIEDRLLNNLLLELHALSAQTGQLEEGSRSVLLTTVQRGGWYGGVLLLFLTLALPPLLNRLFQTISRSLAALQRGMGLVAAGDLGYRLEGAADDETGVLARGFNEMAARLQEITVSRSLLKEEIGERRRAEERLRASEEKYRIVADNTYDWEFWQDPAGNYLYVSPSCLRITGHAPEEFMQDQELKVRLVHPDDRERFVNHQHEAMRQHGEELEFRIVTTDGKEVWLNQICRPIFSADGTFLGTRGSNRDITERRRVEEEIRQLNSELETRVAQRTEELRRRGEELNESQRALLNMVEDLGEKGRELEEANKELQGLDRLKSMFVATMSHELRTPLNSIIGFSSVLLDEWLGPVNEAQKEKLAIVLRTGKHLLTLINDVIDVSKIEAGKLESHLEEFSLADVVTEALELFRKEAADKGLILREEIAGLHLFGDRRRFLQCLINLVSNAVKYSERGEVSVTAAACGEDRLRITVQDTGIGIAAGDLPRLFTAFTRLPSKMTETVKGTGLGLYLVKKIVTEILGGEIGVESRAGEGSTFSIEIPRRLPHETGKSGETHEINNGTGNSSRNGATMIPSRQATGDSDEKGTGG